MQKQIDSNIKPGNTINFGHYLYENNELTSIEWLVLAVQENKALLISRFALESRPYHNQYCDITWKECDLRKWLNNDFFKNAFSEQEKRRIIKTNVENSDFNSIYAISGEDTFDQVFCLSIVEANNYFKNDDQRKCHVSGSKKYNGKNTYYGNCWYWLRNPGRFQKYASYVSFMGDIYTYGDYVTDPKTFVRPAIWVSID